MNDQIAEEERFEYAYRNFIEAAKILAMDAPGLQCRTQGNFFTAYELKSDITAGSYLFNLANHPLSNEQKTAVLTLVATLESIPRAVIDHENTTDGNFAAMSDPWWIPVNEQARKLVILLEPITKKNREYFASLG